MRAFLFLVSCIVLVAIMAIGRAPEPILIGNRFPRLTVRDPLRKLKEIRGFLSRLPAPSDR